MGGVNTIAEEGALLPFGATGATLDDLRRRPDLPLEFRDIENFLPTKRGGKTKNFGFTLHKDVGSSAITGLYRYIQEDGDEYFLVTSGQKLYTLASGTLTEQGTDEIGSGAYVHFETAYDDCIICDGTQGPKKFDGSTVASLGGSPPGQARQSLFIRNRLFIFGNTTDPSVLYYSDAGNIEAGYGTNFINCDKDDGQQITAIYQLFLPAQLDPIIIVGKTRSVGIVTGDGTASAPFTFYKINQDSGIPGFRSVVQHGQNASYLTFEGVKSYRTDINDVNLQQRDISEDVEDQFYDLNRTSLDKSIAWHDPRNTRISFAVPEDGKTLPNVIWHWDTRKAEWYKERYGGDFDITAVLLDSDGTWYHGDSNGDIHVHSKVVYNYNTQPINAYCKTDYIDFYEPHLWKRVIQARAILRGDGNYSLGVSTKLDNGAKSGSSHQLRLTAPAYVWNGGTWTNDPNTYQWGAAPIDIRKFFPSGYFRNMQITFINSNADQPIDLFDLELEIEFLEPRL